MRTPIAAISSALLLAIATQASAQQAQAQGYGPWYGDGFGWPFWWMCPLMMLLMIGVAAFFLLTRRHGGATGFGSGSSASALQILNERYARGEIERQEYEDRKATILSAG